MITTFWHRATMYLTCIQPQLHFIHCIKFERNWSRDLCIMIKDVIITHFGTLFYRHQISIAPIHFPKFDMNISRHIYTMITRSHNSMKNIHNHVIAQFYMCQATLVTLHCIKVDKNCPKYTRTDCAHFMISIQ